MKQKSKRKGKMKQQQAVVTALRSPTVNGAGPLPPLPPSNLNTSQSRLQSVGSLLPVSRWVKPRLDVGVILAILGLGLALYVMRPILSSAPLSPHAPSHGRFLVTNNGHVSINDLRVQCRGNKVVFARRYTLALNGYVVENAYKVPSVAPGESFEVECAQPWSLCMNPREGVFYVGEMDHRHPPPVIDFMFQKGEPVLLHPHGPPLKGWYNLSSFERYPLTGIDATIIIQYQLPFVRLNRSKTMHAIAEDQGYGLTWRVAPDSEPILANGKGWDSFIVTNQGGKVMTVERLR